ncbi:MAG: hypothetical protein Q4A11_06065 [Brachymonas sp.]|nr:hypothetical protein [Brachymonas sp.]
MEACGKAVLGVVDEELEKTGNICLWQLHIIHLVGALATSPSVESLPLDNEHIATWNGWARNPQSTPPPPDGLASLATSLVHRPQVKAITRNRTLIQIQII